MPKLKHRRQLRKGKRQLHPEAKKRRWLARMLVSRTGGLCEYCHKQTNRINGDPLRMTVDHIVPRARGGQTVVENLRLACAQCNAEKGDGVAIDIFEQENTDEV